MKRLSLLLALLAAGRPASAAFEDLGVSARGAGLGHAQTALADDAYAAQANPAGLATLTSASLVSSYGKLFMGLEDGSGLQNSHVAFAMPLGGRRGGIGAAWNYFSLDPLYREHTLSLAYGRRVGPNRFREGLFLGGALKVLSRSLTAGGLARQPLDANGGVVAGVDPVLIDAAKAAPDVDVGALWRLTPRHSVGLRISHLLEPDVAFSDADADPVRRGIDLGASYRTAWSAATVELRHRPAPDGGRDPSIVFAAEKWLPTLLHGDFALRAGLGFGKRDWRQLSAGLSYRVHRLQFDYGWTMPLGGVSSTAGTHRFGLGLRFGGAPEEGRLQDAILESMERLSESPGLEYRYRVGEAAVYQNRAVQDLMRSALGYLETGRIEEARRKAHDASSLAPSDRDLAAKRGRLERLGAAFPRLDDPRDPFQSAVLMASLAYYYDRTAEALEKFRYAARLRPDDDRVMPFLRELAPAQASPAPPPDRGEEARALLDEGRYDEAAAVCRSILEADPKNVLAHLRIGIARSKQRRFDEAAAALEKALEYEPSPDVRKAIQANLDAVRRSAAEKLAPPPAAPPKAADIEGLYQKGVDAYSRGDLDAALALFRRILAADPGNEAAKKAVLRIEAEKKR